MLQGAGKLLRDSGKHPAQLRSEVCTPGGTTIFGLHTLEQGGVRAATMSAVESATERARELGLKSGAGRMKWHLLFSPLQNPNPWTLNRLTLCTVDHRQWWTFSKHFPPVFFFLSFFFLYTFFFILPFVDFANFLWVQRKFWLDFDIVKNLCTFTRRPNGLLLSNSGSNVRCNLIDWIQVPRLCSRIYGYLPL